MREYSNRNFNGFNVRNTSLVGCYVVKEAK